MKGYKWYSPYIDYFRALSGGMKRILKTLIILILILFLVRGMIILLFILRLLGEFY